MSWEAIWTMAGVFTAVMVPLALAFAPFLWRIACNSGKQTEATEATRSDVHELRGAMDRDRDAMWGEHREHRKRLEAQHEKIVDHEARIRGIEKESDPTRKTWTNKP